MPPIRIMLVGDDLEFNQFLQVYVREYVSKSMNKAADFRVYLIPNKMSTLAHYIAMHDDIYCNVIYLAST